MKKEYVYAFVSILLWSTTATITKLLLSSLNSIQILTISSFFAFSFLLIINIVNGNIKDLKNYKTKDYIKISSIGILGTFLYNLFLYLGINNMSASQAFIINYLWPIMIVFFACIILKEKITLRKIIAIIMSFVGVIVVTTNGDLLHIENNSLLGMIYCILAAVSYGLFSVLNKKVSYNRFVSMMLYYLISFIISFLFSIIIGKIFILEVSQLLGLLWIGIFTSAIAFTTWAISLEKGDVVKISNLAYITPFLSLVWTYFILKEDFSIYSIIGLCIIVLGILIQMKNH